MSDADLDDEEEADLGDEQQPPSPPLCLQVLRFPYIEKVIRSKELD